MAFGAVLKRLFKGHSAQADEEFFDGLTDALIEGEVAASVAVSITDTLMKECKGQSEEEVKAALSRLICSYVSEAELLPKAGKTNIWMVLGVNGVGKTTTCAKIANMFTARGYNGEGKGVILAAADTFRAAAIEQLQMHGERIGVRVIHHQMGSDPSAVVFDAAQAAQAGGGALVIADTAGRLHNKEGLVRELQKINKICHAKSDEGCCKKLLVIDATTGQNAVRQAEVFHEAVGVDAIILAKSDFFGNKGNGNRYSGANETADSHTGGGAIITIGCKLHIPVAFVGYGEKYSDIKVFNKESFVQSFVGDK